jgi:hypothetical protein
MLHTPIFGFLLLEKMRMTSILTADSFLGNVDMECALMSSGLNIASGVQTHSPKANLS